MYDLIIIGAGPAGMTAAIYAARREMKVLIISKNIGGQVLWASEIENYPGFQSIGSYDLINKMKDQVEELGVEIKNAEVQDIKRVADRTFELSTNEGVFTAETVLLCLGLFPRRLAIKGEEEYVGRGVTYCANCDGPFYRNKSVAVVGGGNSALDAAEVLSKIATKVFLVHRGQSYRAFESLVEKINQTSNIEQLLNSEIVEIKGEAKVSSILVKTGAEQNEHQVDGVFIEVGRIAHTDFVADLVERNEKQEIIVDEYCRTKTEGLFAAGDVTQIPFKQISSANGQATIAALAAYQYIQLKDGKAQEMIFDRGRK